MSIATPTAVIDSLERSQSIAKHIFGAGSTLSIDAQSVTIDALPQEFITDIASYKVAVTVFTILYLIWIGRSLSNIAGTSFRIANPFAKITHVQGLVKSVRVGDIILEWLLVVALCMLFVTRTVEILEPLHPQAAGLAIHINNMGVGVWMLLIGSIFLAMLMWSVTMIVTSCFFFRSEVMIQELFTIKNRLLMMSIIWLLPLVLLSAMEQQNTAISYIAAIMAVTFVGIYLFRSFLLFMSQKISILHWFLYLCAVELLPITLLWALFVR